jgi:RHH-type proline utilization regulon transcriptional repressor/proline dehydrogenase/delta 1-pyrroline-5-carboxylate dehydrogenase
MAGNRRDFEFQKLHGMGETLYRDLKTVEHVDIPCRGLRAGRLAQGPAALPRAPPAGERGEQLVRPPGGRPVDLAGGPDRGPGAAVGEAGAEAAPGDPPPARALRPATRERAGLRPERPAGALRPEAAARRGGEATVRGSAGRGGRQARAPTRPRPVRPTPDLGRGRVRRRAHGRARPGRGPRRFRRLEPRAGGRPGGDSRPRGGAVRGGRRQPDLPVLPRGRPDARRLDRRLARGGRLPALLRRRGPAPAGGADSAARAHGRGKPAELRPRGVFFTISPWNFPLAIFTGQIAAALAAGNAVIAKPAEAPRSPPPPSSISFTGPASRRRALLLPGEGRVVGRRLVPTPATRASPSPAAPETAWAINRAMAAAPHAIRPFIAETGGPATP